MIKERKKIIYYCTHSNLKDLSYGDSNNDNKFIISIPREFEVGKVFPERKRYYLTKSSLKKTKSFFLNFFKKLFGQLLNP